MDKKIGLIRNININITVAILISFVALLLLSLYILNYDNKKILDIVTFTTTLFAGSTAIFSAYYALAGLKNRIIQDKVVHAQEFVNAIYNFELTKFRLSLSNLDHTKVPPAELYEKIQENPEMATAVRLSFNLFESLSIAIQNGFADEIVSYRALGFIVPYMFDKFKSYTDTVRKKNDNKFIYYEGEKLADAWKNSKYLYSGRDIIIPKSNNKNT